MYVILAHRPVASTEGVWEGAYMAPSRQNAFAAVAAAGLVAALIAAPLAGGAPTSQSPPTISGYPGYKSTLTCKPGNWSPDTTSLAYSWGVVDGYAGGYQGYFRATDQTFAVREVGRDVVCRVTAKDASGDETVATSAPVRTVRGRTSIEVKAKKVQHGAKVTLTGTVKPRGALDKTAADRTREIVAYRVEKDGLHQLFGKETLTAKGKFKIVAADDPGKHRYKVNFNPSDLRWDFAHGFVKVTLKAH
jgi:hypothetical protein